MAVKKKDAPPQTYICYICGEVISGGHVYIRTKRRTELRIHYGCMNVRRDQDGEIGKQGDNPVVRT